MLKINVMPDGVIESVWDDDLVPLVELAEGNVVIKRASHVEPTVNGKWEADMAPVGGPVLGPYSHRSEALVAEREWLDVAGY